MVSAGVLFPAASPAQRQVGSGLAGQSRLALDEARSPVRSTEYQLMLSTEWLMPPLFASSTPPAGNGAEIRSNFHSFLGGGAKSSIGLFRFDFEGQFQPATPALSYFNFRDLFLNFDWGLTPSKVQGESRSTPPLLARLSVQAGRQRLNWSGIDQDWHLGLFQPRFRWNPLSPEEQGLMGLFLQSYSAEQNWSFVGFVSPLFVPDQGSGYLLQEGKFVPANPWFSYPPAQARFARTGAVDDIRYEIVRPEFDEMAFQPSFAGKVKFDSLSAARAPHQISYSRSQSGELKTSPGAWFAQLSVADKPAPQLLLGLDGVLSADRRVDIQIHPTSFRHRVWAAEAGGQISNFGAGIRLASEEPYQPNLKPLVNYEVFGPSRVVNPYFDTFGPAFLVRAQALFLIESESVFVGTKSEMKRSLEASRYQMRSGWALSYTQDGSIWGLPQLRTNLNYLESFDGLDSRVGVKGQWQFSPLWWAFIEGILVRGEGSSSQRRSLFETFNDQDTLWSGVQYVF